MKEYSTPGRKLFVIFNAILLSAIALACMLPIVNLLAISFSSSEFAASNAVKLWPKGFTLKAYQFVADKPEFLRSFVVSAKVVAIGTFINLLLALPTSYVLSRSEERFKWRNVYAWYFVLTMLFNGGLIPGYLTVKEVGLLNSIFALILPGAVQVFSIILLMNFFRSLPKEIDEAALVDGAGHWTNLLKIYAPLSKPALATITLFAIVGHWNSWFDGIIFMNNPMNYPLQSYLQTVIIKPDYQIIASSNINLLSLVNEQTSRAAQIFLATLPILLVYPFFQRYFIKGLVMGSVKG
ncbi:carbohydrate ABC transporter permease [Cohnella silvisoli]|uniref:Carbohydrate ABC transporter permease n=1 Tax=Cohnella silvisoli TaxID=2873699 RepID=A0ABV1KUA3_9BACL|nr:carbohydrate ABC transporter permease [Cohnella silvisoli]MCD9022697.1 carbohydrate ABC transporter permease [Cohnella silvisoli]